MCAPLERTPPARTAETPSRSAPTTARRTVRNRLAVYRAQTEPLLAYYARSETGLTAVDGTGDAGGGAGSSLRDVAYGGDDRLIRLKSSAQIDAIAAAGAIVAEVLEMAAEQAIPGRSTGELDDMAEAMIRDNPGATPAFKGLYGFPATLCTSINEEVVHGIPSFRRELKSGDIVSVDVGVKLDGLFADAAVTIPVGEVMPATETSSWV